MRTALFLAAFAALQIPGAFAQNTPPACDGNIAVVRVSAIKPGGMEGFMAAVAAHKAWYRNHGFNDNVIVASRVILRDDKTGAMKYSDAEVVTYHNTPAKKRREDGRCLGCVREAVPGYLGHQKPVHDVHA